MSEPYSQRHYLALCLDPVHIGTGEFRLGRVNNTIVREPGTNLPKIPGSSLAGIARAYTAMKSGNKYLRKEDILDANGQPEKDQNGTVKKKICSCAGKGGANGDDHCGQPDCPVCTAFGFSKSGLSFQGLAQFSDARLLFFPVASLAGPLWVTCPSSLEAAGCVAEDKSDKPAKVDWFKWNGRLDKRDANNQPEVLALDCNSSLPDRINLGWLYLPLYRTPAAPENQDALPKKPSTWKIRYGEGPESEKALSETPELGHILDRIVLVSDRVFSIIVNDRTRGSHLSVDLAPDRRRRIRRTLHIRGSAARHISVLPDHIS